MANSKNDRKEAENSEDEALCEMLGLDSLAVCVDVAEELPLSNHQNGLYPSIADSELQLGAIFAAHNLHDVYQNESVCILPPELSIPADKMRRLSDELVWGKEFVAPADRNYETIQVYKKGEITKRRVLTRLENFVHHHPEWNDLCNNYLRRCISVLLGEPMVLFKEKLNLKPAGGTGFAPHMDTPSLRVALGETGPQTFVTVMVAIDSMTATNGCLRVAKGEWTEASACAVIAPPVGGNPDAAGRAGKIPDEIAETLEFEDLTCQGGTIAVFNGWAPHRSSVNRSPFPRRAVFLTYNPTVQGRVHELYYEKMGQLRSDWRSRSGLTSTISADEQREMNALATVPRI